MICDEQLQKIFGKGMAISLLNPAHVQARQNQFIKQYLGVK